MKKRKYIAYFFLLLFFIILSGFAKAEELLDRVAMGGITIQPTLADKLKFKSQKITISRNKVQIESVLLNPSDSLLEGELQFTLPPTPSKYTNPDAGTSTWDEMYYRLMYEVIEKASISGEISQQEKFEHLSTLSREHAPFLDFVIQVNGEKVSPEFQSKCLLEKADITAVLINNNIPTSADFMMDMNFFTLGAKTEKIVENIKMRDPVLFARLFDQQSAPGLTKPRWKNQSTYFWKQKFPPGVPITIHLSYRPASGFRYESLPEDSMSAEQSTAQFLQKNVRYYDRSQCRRIQEFSPKESFMNMVKAFFSLEKKFDSDILRVFEVDLLTGCHVNNPIQKFRLEIIPPKNGDMALSWPKDLRLATNIKTDNKYYFVEHENFVPPAIIMVLFIGDV